MLLLAVLIGVLAGPAVASASPAPDSALRYLWVVRTGIRGPAEAARVVERASTMGVRGLLVQVVGRGDAFFRSDLLPRPESIADSTFDPLGALLPAAHAAGLEVHAWMNCGLAWSGPRPPRDPRHVVRAHPEWVATMASGRPMSALRARQLRRMGVEGVFLRPGHPEVRTWIARIAAEIATRYPVDGIHLDYIREPGVALAPDSAARADFASRTGVDPGAIAGLPDERRRWADSSWAAWRGEQVTAIVREVRDSLAQVRPGILLSAAVLSDTAAARSRYAQPWTEWVRSGLLDRAFVMCYAPRVSSVDRAMRGYAAGLGTDGRIVPGIAVYNCEPAQAAAKIRAAVAIGYPTLALYSYDSLYARRGYWAALRRSLAPPADPGRAAGPHAGGVD